MVFPFCKCLFLRLSEFLLRSDFDEKNKFVMDKDLRGVEVLLLVLDIEDIESETFSLASALLFSTGLVLPSGKFVETWSSLSDEVDFIPVATITSSKKDESDLGSDSLLCSVFGVFSLVL